MSSDNKNSSASGWVITGIIFLVFLYAGFFYIIGKKKLGSEFPNPPSANQKQTVDVTPQVQEAMRTFSEQFKDRFDSLQQQIDENKHKTWILGVMSNHNTVAMKNYYNSKGDTSASDQIISLSQAWQLSKMPELLKLTEEDRKKLEKHISPD